jgi:hypothetical protein
VKTLKFIYQYQCIDFSKNIDVEKIQYSKTKLEYRRSGKLFTGNKRSHKICKLNQLGTVICNISDKHVFMYFNTLEILSNAEIENIFRQEKIRI